MRRQAGSQVPGMRRVVQRVLTTSCSRTLKLARFCTRLCRVMQMQCGSVLELALVMALLCTGLSLIYCSDYGAAWSVITSGKPYQPQDLPSSNSWS